VFGGGADGSGAAAIASLKAAGDEERPRRDAIDSVRCSTQVRADIGRFWVPERPRRTKELARSMGRVLAVAIIISGCEAREGRCRGGTRASSWVVAGMVVVSLRTI
jgi:hypothetical protein